MWEKIKKFFKWIADHTGISWIARKISSGWKWLFGGKANATQQNTSQQEKSSGNERQEPAQAQSKGATTPKTLDDADQSIPPAAPDEPQGPVINTSETDAKELPENFPTPNPQNADSDVLKEASNENYLKVGDKGLLLVLTSEQFAKCKDYKDSQSTSPGGLLMYIKCGENEYRITGTNNDNLPNTICIKSILKKSKDGKYVNGNIVLVEEEIKHVKKMLELNNDGVVKVDSISNSPFKTATPEQPNTNATGNGTAQPNDSNVDEEVKKVIEGLVDRASTTGQQSDLNTNTKEADNLQPETSADGSTSSSDSSSFVVVKKDGNANPESPEVSAPATPTDTTDGSLSDPESTAEEPSKQSGIGNDAIQQVVNNDSNETEVKQASGSTTADQAPEQPASGSEVASPSGSQSTTADSNEPKSERIEAPTLEQPNSNNNILNQQPAGPGGLLNNKGPQSTTPNQPVNQDNMAGSKPSPTKQVDEEVKSADLVGKVSAQDSSKIGETQNSPTTDSSADNKKKFFDAPEELDAQPNSLVNKSVTEKVNKSATEKKNEPDLVPGN